MGGSGSGAAWALPSLLVPLRPKRRLPPCLRLVLQHLGVEAEVEAHALGPALFVAGGDGAELAVPGLPAPVPALNLGGEAQEAGLGAAATHLCPPFWHQGSAKATSPAPLSLG